MKKLYSFAFVMQVLAGGLCWAQTSAPVSEKAPDPNRGVYAIWYQNGRDYLLDLPFIKGGQVYAQWGDVEKEEGKYDWSSLDKQLKLLHDKKFKCTVQINANVKPEWMFEKIPYWPKPLQQVQNKKGTPMYWHPDFIKAYLRFLSAQADYVRKSPYRDCILGMRMNFSAIGNEYLNGKATGADLSKWVVPAGANREGMRVWDDSISTEYEKMIVQAYIDRFLPDIFVFVRAHLDAAARDPYISYFEEGKMGWFHTGAQAIEVKDAWWQNLYQMFYQYCRTGKTRGYAEPIADAMGYHGSGKKSGTPASGPQVNYWRLLVDLQYGIDYIACYGSDLNIAYDGTNAYGKFKNLQDEYFKADQFTAKYVGYLNSPSVSPGAWVALRKLDRKPGEEKLLLTDDCNFSMKRLPDDSTGVKHIGPDEQRFGGWARVLPKGKRMRFDIDDRFVNSINEKPSIVNLIYYDKGVGKISLTASGREFTVGMKDTGRWQTASFDLTKSHFISNSEGADISVISNDQDIIVHMVEVTHPSPQSQPASRSK